MSYNKAIAEMQWRAWKEAEEKKLRELGVDEDTIQRLHTYDWEEFNRERRYQDWLHKGKPGIDPLYPEADIEIPVRDGESLLDNIESQELFSVLKDVDKKTLEILLMKICGYSSMEISRKTDLTVNAIDLRIHKLKKKIKNFLCSGKI